MMQPVSWSKARERGWAVGGVDGRVALAALGDADVGPLRLVVTETPDHALAKAQDGNWRTMDFHAVFWLPDRALAKRVRDMVQDRLLAQGRKEQLPGGWF
ncbi:MAG: hypothetical protein AAFO58_05275, partial [Pseudomonadota bacterium]